MHAMQFETVKIALKQDATGYVLTLRIHPDEIPEELLRDFVGARYMLAMARINDDDTLVASRSIVQQAGMLCRSPAFQKYCQDRYGADVSEDGATAALYGACEIQSRTQLNGSTSAKKLFAEMLSDFEKWSNENHEPF
jgi:hypothetical protein